jgi:hypothetical protein
MPETVPLYTEMTGFGYLKHNGVGLHASDIPDAPMSRFCYMQSGQNHRFVTESY